MKLITPVAILAALTLSTAPAFAQHERGNQSRSGDNNSGQSQGHAVARPHADAPRGQAPHAEAPRAEAPRAQAPRAEAPRAQAPRAETPRAQAPRAAEPQRSQPPRVVEQPRAEPRSDNDRRQNNRGQDGNRGQYDSRGRYDSRGQYDSRGRYENRGRNDGRLGRAVPRGNVIVRPRVDRPIIVSPRYYGPRGYYSAPYYGYRPYTFRPRTHIAFGIYLGYGVPYSYAYPYPVPVYGYGGPSAPVVVGPGSSYYGGVSLEITPNNAEVYVDGEYVGLVQDFDGTQQPLTLTAGSHRLEIRAAGYEPLTLDVNVNPGEVLPYRGDLYRY
jgi:hypothetical protein